MSDEGQYYYSLKSHRVVRPDEEKSEERLGPYPTYADAEAALKQVQARNESWDTDPTWNDEDDPDATRLDGAPKADDR